MTKHHSMRKALLAKTYLSLEALLAVCKITSFSPAFLPFPMEFIDGKRPGKEKCSGAELRSYLGRNKGATLWEMIPCLGKSFTSAKVKLMSQKWKAGDTGGKIST